MTVWLRLFERIHGHLGWLSVAALVHPAILLRRPRPQGSWIAGAAAGLTLASGVLGACLYPAYRQTVKVRLLHDKTSLAWLLERKEHLAIGAVAFAVAGWLLQVRVPGLEKNPAAIRLRKLAHLSFVAALLLTLLVSIFGTWVASHDSF